MKRIYGTMRQALLDSEQGYHDQDWGRAGSTRPQWCPWWIAVNKDQKEPRMERTHQGLGRTMLDHYLQDQGMTNVAGVPVRKSW